MNRPIKPETRWRDVKTAPRTLARRHTATATPGYRVEVVTEPERFGRLVPAWEELARASGIGQPFLTPAWMMPWWQAFGGKAQLRIIAVYRDGILTALAPLMLERVKVCGMRVRALKGMANPHTPSFDILVGPGASGAREAVWQTICARRNEWDLVLMPELEEGSKTLMHSQERADARGLPNALWWAGDSPYLDIQLPWDEYFHRLSKKLRANLRQRRRRLEQWGDVELELDMGWPDTVGPLQQGLAIEAAAWKEAAGTAVRNDPAVAQFYHRLSRRAAECGWLRLAFLRVGGVRVAFAYMLEHSGVMYMLKQGYDPRFNKGAPGVVMQWLLLEHAFRAGVRRFEFLGRSEPFKKRWTPAARRQHWLYIFNAGLSMRALHWSKFALWPRLRPLGRAATDIAASQWQALRRRALTTTERRGGDA